MGRIFKQKNTVYWWIDYIDHTGKRVRRSSGSREKQTAAKILAKAESDAAMIASGLLAEPNRADAKTLKQHLVDYERAQRAKNGDRHVDDCLMHIRAIADYCGLRPQLSTWLKQPKLTHSKR